MSDRRVELEAARLAGRAAAEATIEQAPTGDPLVRLAWLKGHGSVEVLEDAVQVARQAGFTWPQIGDALDEHPATARTKFGGGREAMRRYRERLRREQSES